MQKSSNIYKGIFYIILSAFFFSLMAVFVRLAGDIHFIQKAFFRNSISFLIALFLILMDFKKGKITNFKFSKIIIFYLFLRSAAGSIGIFGNFYAIDKINIADASILNKMSPFFAIVFSYFLLKEKIKLVPLLTICVAFVGAIFIIKPSFDFSKFLPTFVAFLGGMGAGLAYSVIRKLKTLNCDGKIIVLFFSAFSMLLSVPYIILNFNPMTNYQLICLIMTGVCAAGGQFTITNAYYHASAKDISIYDYSQIIFSTSFGFFIFGQVPDALSITGYVIIVSMAFVNFFFETKKKSIV